MLLDEIARELRIVIAHMGYPWTNEKIVLLAKHPIDYAQISGLPAQPWQAYQTLHSVAQASSATSQLILGVHREGGMGPDVHRDLPV